MIDVRVEGALEKYFGEYEKDPDFVAEGMALSIAEDAVQLMQAKGLTQAALANAMGVSPAHVSRVLNAPPNLTLRSIARLALALGTRPVVRLDMNVSSFATSAQSYLPDADAFSNLYASLVEARQMSAGGDLANLFKHIAAPKVSKSTQFSASEASVPGQEWQAEHQGSRTDYTQQSPVPAIA